MSAARELFRDESAASGGIDEPLGDLRFVQANAIQQAKGLLSWVYGTYGDVRLDGLRVSWTRQGRYVGRFRGLTKNSPVPEVVEKEAFAYGRRGEGVL